MAFDFPSNPTIGQEYNPGPLTYVWSGYGWTIKGMSEAPNDGQLYGRKSLAWSVVPTVVPAPTKRNYIINGAMMISQENGSTVGTVNGYYPVDQFKLEKSGTTGAVNIARVSAYCPSGSTYRTRVTVTTADAAVAASDIVSITQPLEGQRIAGLAMGLVSAKSFAISFGVKAPAGTYSVLVTSFANPGHAYAAEYVIAAGEANTDVIKSVVIPADTAGGYWSTDNSACMVVRWGLMCGSNYAIAPGVWTTLGGGSDSYGSTTQFNFMATVGNVFELFDVSMTDGATPQPLVMTDYPTELALCQRYYVTISALTGAGAFGVGIAQSSSSAFVVVPIPVSLRGTGSGGIKTAYTDFVCNGGTMTSLSVSGFVGNALKANIGGSAFTVNSAVALQANNASAQIWFNSRL